MNWLLFFISIICIFGQCEQAQINDFESCVNAGYPVREIYPRECIGPSNAVFAEKINDMIITRDPEELLIASEISKSHVINSRPYTTDNGRNLQIKSINMNPCNGCFNVILSFDLNSEKGAKKDTVIANITIANYKISDIIYARGTVW